MEPKIKKRDSALDVLRGLAVVGVLLIHITADYAYADGRSLTYAIMNPINKLFYWAVPSFVTLTVYLALRKGRRLGPRYVLRHAAPVLGLYVLWSAVYLVFQTLAFNQPPPDIKSLILDCFLQGKACYHLYYVVMLIQLYVVIAILSLLPVKRLKPSPWMPWAALALQLAVLAAFEKLIVQRFWFYNTAIFPIFYVLPITLGVMLAADDVRTKEMFRSFSPVFGFCAGFAAAGAAWFAASGAAAFEGSAWGGALFNTGIGTLFNLGAVPLAFLLAERLQNLRPLEILGRRSLTVYFAHPLALYLIDAFFDFHKEPLVLLTGMAVKLAVLAVLSLGYAYAAERFGKRK